MIALEARVITLEARAIILEAVCCMTYVPERTKLILFFFFQLSFPSDLFNVRRLPVRIARFFQSVIVGFVLYKYKHFQPCNLLLTKHTRDRTGRISALRLFFTDLAVIVPYCQRSSGR